MGVESAKLSDISELRALLDAFNEDAEGVRERVKSILGDLKAGDRETQSGVSFLEVKNYLMLSYSGFLAYYLNIKLKGGSIGESDLVNKLVRSRTIMERLRPIDAKLKYQVDKLVKTAIAGENAEDAANNALSFKPNVDNLVAKEDEHEEEGSAGEQATVPSKFNDKKKSGVYRAPRLTSMPYELDDNTGKAQLKKDERRRKKLEKSGLLKEMHDEISERPSEMRSIGAEYADKETEREDKERSNWEEERFVRSVVSRKDKIKKRMREREATGVGTLAAIDDFGAVDQLTGGEYKGRKAALGTFRGAAETRKQLRQEAVSSKRSKARGAATATFSAPNAPRSAPASADAPKKKAKVSFSSLFGSK